jgi:hypothetical protein
MPDKSKDAIALLKADHRAVEELFEKYQNAASSEQKRSIAEKICIELVIHTMIEEEIFYPALRGKIEGHTLEEAYVEHDGAKVLIADLIAGSPSDEFYDAKITVLKEEIRHHVHEEEKRGEGMFAQARAAEVDLDALGARLAKRKEELKRRLTSKSALRPTTRTLRSEVAHGSIAA